MYWNNILSLPLAWAGDRANAAKRPERRLRDQDRILAVGILLYAVISAAAGIISGIDTNAINPGVWGGAPR